jgi:AhpD family alkylhydroperoxidase
MKSRWKWISVSFASVVLIAAVVAYGSIKTGEPDPVTTAQNTDRQQIYNEMESMLGTVPGFFRTLPDASLEAEWNTFKAVEAGPGEIPLKYRELIGVAVSAARGCEYCTYYHTQFARLHGATDEELTSAVQLAKTTMGWSTYLYGTQASKDEFENQVDEMVEYRQSMETSSR